MYTVPDEAKASEGSVEEDNLTAVEATNGAAAGLLEHFSQLVELLTSMSSVLELLSQAAQSSLDEQERQVKQVDSARKFIAHIVLYCQRRHILIFGSLILILTPVEQLDTVDKTVNSVDLQTSVTHALPLLFIFYIVSKRSV